MPRSRFTAQYDQFRRTLIAARKSAGLTQSDVAAALEKPQSFVSKYERGERRLDVVEFVAVAKILGLNPRQVINELASGDQGSGTQNG